jgi:hypothetical protein
MRGIAPVVMLAGLIGLGGCLNIQDKEEREPWTKRQWQAELHANDLRLKSEDDRNKGAWTGSLNKATDALWEQIIRIYNYLSGESPYIAAKDLLDPTAPDKRRQAIIYLSKHDYGRNDPYVTYYAEMVRP